VSCAASTVPPDEPAPATAGRSAQRERVAGGAGQLDPHRLVLQVGVDRCGAALPADTGQSHATERHARSHRPVRHVSPHGKLGNLCVTHETYARGVLDAVLAFDQELVVVCQEGVLTAMAREHGLPVAVIGFADRNYNDDGTLVDRRHPDALVRNADLVVERAVQLATKGTVTTVSGTEIPVPCDTVLVHGDTAGSVTLARRVRAALEAAGVTIAPFHAPAGVR